SIKDKITSSKTSRSRSNTLKRSGKEGVALRNENDAAKSRPVLITGTSGAGIQARSNVLSQDEGLQSNPDALSILKSQAVEQKIDMYFQSKLLLAQLKIAE